jgi:uncharacterized HAD superfamily protein
MDYIFDIDDTLSNSAHRAHWISKDNPAKNWSTYYNLLVDDSPITPVVTILQNLYEAGHRIILCTGRPEKYRDITVQWLEQHDIPAHDLFMRQTSETGLRNAQAKQIMLNRIKDAGYSPAAVFEDNPLSVEMWKSCGLVVLQIA